MSKLKGTILITGANGGLGTAFVQTLISSPLALEYRGLFTVRNTSGAGNLQQILTKAPKSFESELLDLDLSSLESIRNLAHDINCRVTTGALEPIRALVLNAAWQECNAETLKPKTMTKDGFEGNFGINYLANFSFVLQILQSMDKKNGRIVIVSSSTHDPFDPFNNLLGIYKGDEFKTMFPDLESVTKGIEYTDDGYKAGVRRYGASKTLMVMFM
jgi:NAD(P)-dependent dehydrogenase (short-subunit alcohol dehydrogenase family)